MKYQFRTESKDTETKTEDEFQVAVTRARGLGERENTTEDDISTCYSKLWILLFLSDGCVFAGWFSLEKCCVLLLKMLMICRDL